jgi:hypothetical protein
MGMQVENEKKKMISTPEGDKSPTQRTVVMENFSVPCLHPLLLVRGY